MLITPRARIAAVTIAVLLVATVLGYWALREYRARAVHGVVASLLAETTSRLRDALAGEPQAGPAVAFRRLDGQAEEVDQRLAALRRLRPAPDRALVDAAELYMVTAREVLRRGAASHGYRDGCTTSTQALYALAATADHRSGAWIGRVIAAKERAERDCADYRRALDAVASLLDSLSEPRARLARQVDPAVLVEEPLRAEGASRAREQAKRAADALADARRRAER